MSLIAELGLVPPRGLLKAAPPAEPPAVNTATAKASEAKLLAAMSEVAKALKQASEPATAVTPDQRAALVTAQNSSARSSRAPRRRARRPASLATSTTRRRCSTRRRTS